MHRCVKCGATYPDGAKEVLEGCSECGSHFFYYVKDGEEDKVPDLDKDKIDEIEEDIRDIIGDKGLKEKSVVLDLETIRVPEPGKYEIDLTKAFNKDRPVVFKYKGGKYMIDLSALKKEKLIKKLREGNK